VNKDVSVRGVHAGQLAKEFAVLIQGSAAAGQTLLKGEGKTLTP